MDNLTHSLTGLMLARAGLAKFSGRGTAILVVASNIPDIDVVSWVGGPVAALEYHRWYTHTLLFSPLMAALAVLLVRLIGRKPIPWWPAFGLSMIGVLSHLAFDWTNSYGIRLLMPFNREWLRLDLNNVIDAWILAILLLAVAAPFLSKLVSSEIGGKSGTGKGMAIFALVFIVIFDFGRYLAHERALSSLQSRLYRDTAAVRTAAFPLALNPLRWAGYVEGQDFLSQIDVNLLREFDPNGGETYYKPERSPAIDAARKNDTVRKFLEFSSYPLWRLMKLPGDKNETAVEVIDLRFGTPAEPQFLVTAVVDGNNHVESAKLSMTGR